MSVEDLYQEVLLEHYRNPVNKFEIESPTVKKHLLNPLCGDEVTLMLRVEGDVIAEASFDGRGCSISQASASMLSSQLEGKTLDEARALFQRFEEMMKRPSEEEADDFEDLGDAQSMAGVRRFAARIKCATLAWEALLQCIDDASSKG